MPVTSQDRETLKSVYRLAGLEGTARPGDVAEALSISPATATARLKKLDGMLREREAAAGGELGVMRELLEDIRRAAAAAKDDASRRRVWNQMSELQAQLR